MEVLPPVCHENTKVMYGKNIRVSNQDHSYSGMGGGHPRVENKGFWLWRNISSAIFANLSVILSANSS